MAVGRSSILSFGSVIRGHHVYKTVWTPSIGEMLESQPDTGNKHDRYAIGMVKDGEIVGHAPKEISRIFHYFIQHNGTISAEVTGHRKLGKGLEIPCNYILKGKPRYIERAKKTLKIKH